MIPLSANTYINDEGIQQIATMISMAMSKSISDLFIQNCTWEKRKAVGIDELCKIFGMERNAMLRICREKDSPAFKNGKKTAPWLCFPDEMHKYLLKKAKQYKS